MEGSRPRPGGGAAPVARNSMDYSLAALKLFGSQLAGATEAPSSEGSSQAQMLYGIRFQRAWLQVAPVTLPTYFSHRLAPSPPLTTRGRRQGVIVLADYSGGAGLLLVDDGSCVAELTLKGKDAEGQPWRKGMYIMVIGSYVAKASLPHANRPVIKVHKLVDLSAQPDREAMWYMEVAEAYNFFYLQFSAASSHS
ncbi:hypothetical protein GUJ93_ZPchr0092g38065 [Zizania palustris]|uniref:RecQ-mediated genome instability protein 2 n=1 Tax=Zizania palustris TaxID=103762 RepID=A0A8J5RAW7_ZIZPA|nr:hypothetical protein GUJ93_ZPchr0092g38065 [Zizania palustris]